MSKIHMLREFVNKRLIDVAEEICDIFERTFAEYEEEAKRSRRRPTINTPSIYTLKEEEWRPCLEDQEEEEETEPPPSLEDQEDTEPPLTQYELSQGHLQTWDKDEAGSTKRTMPPTFVKSEYDYAQPSPLHLSHNEEYNGQFLPCGVSEPSSQTHSPDCSVAGSDENGNNDNCRENGGPLSSFITHTFSSRHTKEEPYICNGCGKEFYQSTYISDSCAECVEVFNQNMGIVREPFAQVAGAYHVGETSMQRGKTTNVESGVKNKHKRLRHLGQSYINSKNVLVPGKRLREKNCSYCRYKCNENFPESERAKIFEHFWGIGDSVQQKNFILTHVLKRNKKRHTTESDSRRQNSIEYFFTSEGRKIRVCKDFFLRTLDVSGTFARSAYSMCPSLK